MGYPWVICSRTCSRPLSTALMSTFLRQAFLPLREGCFDFGGAVGMFAGSQLCGR